MFTKSKWKRFKDQSGMAMPMVLMIMVLALCIVGPGLVAAGTTANVNRELESSTVAYYAAKAGIEDARLKFRNNIMDLENITVNGMAVEVSKTVKAGPTTVDGFTSTTYIVKSTARNETIIAEMVVTRRQDLEDNDKIDPPGEMPAPGSSGYPFWYAIASTNGDITVNATTKVISTPDNYADVFANKGKIVVDLAPGGYIHGKAYATTGIYDGTRDQLDRITGGLQIPPPAEINFAPVDETWYLDKAELGTRLPTCTAPCAALNLPLPTPYPTTTYGIPTGTTIIGEAGKLTYVNGNLNIDRNVTLKGVVWVNGNVQILSNTYLYVDASIDPDTNKIRQSYLLAHGSATDQHSITVHSNSKVMATKNNLNLISDNGNITIDSAIDGPMGNGSTVLLGILYAPNGLVEVNSNANVITSAILGKSVLLDSNVTVNYDKSLRDNPPDGFEINVTEYTPAPTVVMTTF